jgi:hypothetical protein
MGAREVGIEVGANRSEHRSAVGSEWKSLADQWVVGDAEPVG